MMYLSGLSQSQIQEALVETGEVVLDLVEKEAVVSSDSSEEADSAGQKASMLSYDLNKRRMRMNIHIVECLLIRRMPGT
ncbi:hypothetical protein Ahy_B08g090182 [Arachis hypogaea]|uniref:Uncharacterized protein n=1 Tax=Arachis hypogaea TaxID=3818 RepID=A0A444XZT7_ARAHY|nr:hypothetical protein Ahy_B08g090182 [Arachis hypogaea]